MSYTEFDFRTLNYLGSKLRLLDFIEEQVMRVTPEGGVCDLFAGSGCVSFKLSRTFHVTSCDIQNYSKIICNALLCKHDISENEVADFIERLYENNSLIADAFRPLVSIEEKAIAERDSIILTDIIEHGSVEVYRIEKAWSSLASAQRRVVERLRHYHILGKQSLVSRYYGGVYFSYKQAVEIDQIWNAIRCIENPDKKDLYLAALISTVSDVVDTVGKHFAQPIKARDSKGKIKKLVCNKAEKDKTIEVIPLYEEWLKKYIYLPKSDFKHTVIQGDYMDCLRILNDDVKTVYADPPYTRDHYSRFYHVLETLALDDEPGISTVKIHGSEHVSNGIYRKDRHQSPFCIRSKSQDAFEQMFKQVSDSGRNLLLSYSPYDETKKTHPRVVTMSQLVTWAKDYFNKVETVSAGHFSHNKLNSTEHFLDASDEAEMLIVCTK